MIPISGDCGVTSAAPRVIIRCAAPDDAALLAALGSRLFAETYSASHNAKDIGDYTGVTFSTARQRAELDDARCRYLIVERTDPEIARAHQSVDARHRDGEAAGYALLRLASPPLGVEGARPVEIARFYLDRAWHGQGVAALLMTRCLDEARDWKGDTVWLSVWEHNFRAIRFYERRGFLTVGSQPFRFGTIDEMDPIMARPLD